MKQTIDYTIINKCVFMENTLTLDRKSIPKRYPRFKASLQFVEFPTIDLHGYLNVSPTGPKPIVLPFTRAIRKQLTKLCCQSFSKNHNCDNLRNDRSYIVLINVLFFENYTENKKNLSSSELCGNNPASAPSGTGLNEVVVNKSNVEEFLDSWKKSKCDDNDDCVMEPVEGLLGILEIIHHKNIIDPNIGVTSLLVRG